MKRTLGLAATAGALAVAMALVLSACGGSDGSDGVASLTDTTNGAQSSGNEGAADPQEWEQAQLAFARCMREHGVDFPDPENGRFRLRSRPGEEQKVQEAQEACREILEDVAPPIDEEQQAEMREAALDFAKCMREHGIDMPDPQFQNGGMTQRMPEGAEDDPDFQEAQKACQPILDAARRDGPPVRGGSS